MRIISGVFGLALLGVSSVALAEEPVRLDAAQLDAVSAGAFSTGALAFSFPSFGQGNLINASQLNQTFTASQIVITPTAVQSNAIAQASAVSRIQGTGPGATASGTGGGVYTTIFLF